MRILWAGNFDEYLLHPPEVHLPEGVAEEGISATSSSEEGQNVVTYRVRLSAETDGRFALDPVEILYTPRGEAEPVASRIAGPTVNVEARKIAGMEPKVALATGSAAVLLVFGLVGWSRRRSSRRERADDGAEARYARLAASFETAKRARLEGDAYGFLAEIAALEDELGAAGGQDREELEAALERARYGGQSPPPEVLDRLSRRAERLLAEIRPDAGREDRRALRLKAEPHRGAGHSA